MKLTRTVKVATVAVVIAVTVAVGATAAVTGAATGSTTTFYGCLKTGKLTAVGTTAPTCPTGATQIQWDSQGPAGPQGSPGAQGPVGQASIVNLPSAASCPTPGPVTVSNVPLAYLGIPSIPGESTDVAHPNQIDVLSWSLGSTGAGAGQGCGATTGPAGQGGAGGQQLTIVKGIDKASPLLMQAATGGTNLGTVSLGVTKQSPGGMPFQYLRYTFTLVQVKSVSWSHDDQSPKETVTFQYGGLSITYTPKNPDGSTGTPIVACFDFNLQSPC